MANIPRRREREDFFKRLDSLDDSDDGGEDNAIIRSNTELTKDRTLNPSHERLSQLSQLPRSEPYPITTKVVPKTTPCAVFIKPTLQTRHEEKKSKAGTKRSATDRIPPKPKRSKVGPGKEVIPEDRQLFKGLTFYFMPDDDVFKPRRLRIQKALAHGAVWARSISPLVTHVITEVDIDYRFALRSFPNQTLPGHVFLVKENWLTESLGFKVLKDCLLKRFRLQDAPEDPDTSTSLARPATLVEQSPVVTKPLKSTHLELGQQYHSSEVEISTNIECDGLDEDMAHGEELNRVLQEVKADKTMTLGTIIEIDTLVSFEEHTARHQIDDSDTNKTDNERMMNVNKGFACMEKNDGEQNNPNFRTIKILQQMASYYDRIGDNWRTVAYRKAMTALRKQTVIVSSKAQALKIPHIGERLTDKIEEIVTTDRLRRLESTKLDPDDQVLQLFMGIHGVGFAQARRWIARGYRTLEHLYSQADLTAHQKIGLDHHDDFLQRIPRNEVKQHADIVKATASRIDPTLEVIIGGSYRRGNTDSGDIDLIVTKPDASPEHLRTLLLDLVIPELVRDGFLKHALASRSSREDSSKWHGASALPDNPVWRRIDLLFVPWDELGAALIYFTGNDIFNRSMRLLASHKGMRLNQRGLYADVMRGKGRKRLTEGRLLEGRSERKIFEILGVPWRPPHHRKC